LERTLGRALQLEDPDSFSFVKHCKGCLIVKGDCFIVKAAAGFPDGQGSVFNCGHGPQGQQVKLDEPYIFNKFLVILGDNYSLGSLLKGCYIR